jgi:hypothetical protein
MKNAEVRGGGDLKEFASIGVIRVKALCRLNPLKKTGVGDSVPERGLKSLSLPTSRFLQLKLVRRKGL